MEVTKFYGETDPRELPLYSRREAAHFIRVSVSTMEGWVAPKIRDSGSRLSEPVIRVPRDTHGRLSFNNLVEAYVLKLLRSKHDVSMQAVRRAVAYAEREMRIDRLLMRKELRFGKAGDLFWDKYLGELITLSRGGQLAMREIVEEGLLRIEWDEATGLPLRFFPLVSELAGKRSILIDPRVCFGQPTVAGYGVITAAILSRVNAGEDEREVALDYGMPLYMVKDVLIYEASQN